MDTPRTDRTISGVTYVDHLIDLSGGDYRDCTFDGCICVLAPQRGTILISNHFEDCFFEGDGWEEALRQPGGFRNV